MSFSSYIVTFMESQISTDSIWVSQYIECFHMTSRRPYWCPKTMKRRPCWCPKPILWELNSFLMQTLSFVPINLHMCWPREWKHSIYQCKGFASEITTLPWSWSEWQDRFFVTFSTIIIHDCVQILQLMLPHIIFYSLCKEMKQQMEEQTTIFVQITYKSHKDVPRHFPVVQKHMADICTSDCLAVMSFWRSARLKFIPILKQKVRALFFPPVYFVGIYMMLVCVSFGIFCLLLNKLSVLKNRFVLFTYKKFLYFFNQSVHFSFVVFA